MLLPVEPEPAGPAPVLLPLEPLGELLVLPAPGVLPCDCRQRAFSAPDRLSHAVVLPALGVDGALELLEPLEDGLVVDGELLLEDPPTPLPDDDCAKDAAENASSAEAVAVAISFNVIDVS